MFTQEQFTCLAKKYIDTVFRVAFGYLKNREDAEDVTQDVFCKLLQAKKPFESEDHIKHWLIRVTINECKKGLLSPWRQAASFEDYAATLTFETPQHSELFYAVMALPGKYRMPIYLHYYEGYTAQEIGKLLGLPKGTVCTNLKRGREQLKKLLQEDSNDG